MFPQGPLGCKVLVRLRGLLARLGNSLEGLVPSTCMTSEELYYQGLAMAMDPVCSFMVTNNTRHVPSHVLIPEYAYK